MPARASIIVKHEGLSTSKRKAALAALVEGISINATVRMTGVSKQNILQLLKNLGCAYATYHDEHVRGLEAGACPNG